VKFFNVVWVLLIDFNFTFLAENLKKELLRALNSLITNILNKAIFI